ncbi:hypothetical protein TWF481_008417 [Arthrobotrys musiformis]|uniref:Uncharacterized protein n=1 Tax=Arthrobotrys musiformis TaxID=47236 RepID=A0AAV9W735_9PEZI
MKFDLLSFAWLLGGPREIEMPLELFLRDFLPNVNNLFAGGFVIVNSCTIFKLPVLQNGSLTRLVGSCSSQHKNRFFVVPLAGLFGETGEPSKYGLRSGIPLRRKKEFPTRNWDGLVMIIRAR